MPPGFYLYKRIVQAKLFIDNNSADPIDLDQISDEAYFSKFHFIRLFRKMYGRTPHLYLIAVRQEKAKLLLAKGMTVSDVCVAVGFESLSTFSGKFKQAFGMTPTAFIAYRADQQQQPLKYIPGCFISNFEEVR
ncbi:AraC family transcriptional regulator [Chitinophaga sp.]|uniref:AraC family transcriptional regulator n=1 Tax=Chitinophaga sp. TaxID=1869181 RepID=UPI0031DC2921